MAGDKIKKHLSAIDDIGDRHKGTSTVPLEDMLSDRKIKQAKARDRKYKLNDYDGLFLIVQPLSKRHPNKPPSKLWRFRYTKHGKTKEISLGKYPAVSLSAARPSVISHCCPICYRDKLRQ